MPPATRDVARTPASANQRIAAQSSTIATARTGAAVVPDPLDREDRELEAVRAAADRGSSGSRDASSPRRSSRGAPPRSACCSNIAQTGGSKVIASQPIMRTPCAIRWRVASAVMPGVVGAVALLGVVRAGAGVDEDDVALLQLVADRRRAPRRCRPTVMRVARLACRGSRARTPSEKQYSSGIALDARRVGPADVLDARRSACRRGRSAMTR